MLVHLRFPHHMLESDELPTDEDLLALQDMSFASKKSCYEIVIENPATISPSFVQYWGAQ
jgi:hypothetical protein